MAVERPGEPEPVERDERGQILLRMRGCVPHRAVLASVTRIARTFRGHVRGEFTPDDDLTALAGLPFAREISPSGQQRVLDVPNVERQMREAYGIVRRAFAELGTAQDFETSLDLIAGEDALPDRLHGIIAFGEPVAPAGLAASQARLSGALAHEGVGGALLAGSSTVRSTGPVISLIEPGGPTRRIIDTAERIAGLDDERVVVAIGEGSAAENAGLRKAVHEALDPGTRASIVQIGWFTPTQITALAHRSKAGLVVGWLAGDIGEQAIMRLASQLTRPLLLLR